MVCGRYCITLPVVLSEQDSVVHESFSLCRLHGEFKTMTTIIINSYCRLLNVVALMVVSEITGFHL